MTDVDWGLLTRYLAGACTPEERAQVEQWLEAAPDRRELLDRARDAFADGDRTMTVGRLGAMLARVRQEVATGDSAHVRAFTVATRARTSRAIAIAAGILLAVGLGITARTLLRRGAASRADTAMQTMATPRGQRASFRLADGTHVLLGPASTLRYPRSIGEHGSREVRLEGEAFFEVTHDAQRPFIVRTRDIIATDLGTAFAVRAYPDDGHAEVVVREGTVAVGARLASPVTADHPTTVTAGQRARLDKTNTPIVEPADTAMQLAWLQGRLVFRHTPLRDVLPDLSRWYDVEFRLADSSVGAIEVSGIFKQQLTPEGLDLLDMLLGVRHEQRGRVITLYPAIRGS